MFLHEFERNFVARAHCHIGVIREKDFVCFNVFVILVPDCLGKDNNTVVGVELDDFFSE